MGWDEFATFDTVVGDAGAYTYSGDVWNAAMADGYGGDVTDGDNNSLLCGGQVCGYTWSFMAGMLFSTNQMPQGVVTTPQATIGQSQPAKPAWNAKLPDCWAVGAQAVWNAMKGTISPLPSVSTGIGILSGGGDLVANGAKAVSYKALGVGFLLGLDYNLVSQWNTELNTPCQ